MTIKEKLSAEQNNERTVRLYLEAMFYKAYERSAYLFVTQIRSYSVRRFFIKAAGQDVVTVGFPMSVLESLDVAYEAQSDGTIVITLPTPLDEQTYQQWRDAIPYHTGNRKPLKAEEPLLPPAPDKAPAMMPAERRVLQRVREINLANATPMQCMMLLAELQKELNTPHE